MPHTGQQMPESHGRCFTHPYPQSVENILWVVNRQPDPSDHSKRGVMNSMSSMQWRGGGGSSSGAITMRSSVPHTVQR